MNVKQFKIHLMRGLIRPEYFYLPLKAKKVLKNPFKYRVVSSIISITFPSTIYFAFNNQSNMRVQTSNKSNTISCCIDWGDGTYTDVSFYNGEGYYQDKDGEKINVDSQFIVSHTYTDNLEHIVSISGKCACLQLGKFPVGIIQWGDIGMESINMLVYGYDEDSPCRDEFTVPNTPITGCENVTYIFDFLCYTALEKVPDSMLVQMQSLIYANYVFYYNDGLKYVGNEICKGLSSLASIKAFFAENSNLTTIGNGIFENCTNIGRYIDYEVGYNAGNWRLAFYDNNRMKKIGDRLFKGCTGIQSLISEEQALSDISNNSLGAYLPMYYFPEGHRCEIGSEMFSGCTELKNISNMFYGGNIQYFSGDTFKGCTKIVAANQTFYQNDAPFRCGEKLFDDLINLKSISYAFYKTAIDTVPKFPNSPLTIINNVFYGSGAADNSRSAQRTSLPELSGNNYYLGLRNGNKRYLTNDNVADYIEVWHAKPLDCTGIFTSVIGYLTSAGNAFYSDLNLTKSIVNPPAGGASTAHYDNIWFGDMYPFWNNANANALRDALTGCLGINNFDSISNDLNNQTHILEYIKPQEYASMSNTEFMRLGGERLITEWTE